MAMRSLSIGVGLRLASGSRGFSDAFQWRWTAVADSQSRFLRSGPRTTTLSRRLVLAQRLQGGADRLVDGGAVARDEAVLNEDVGVGTLFAPGVVALPKDLDRLRDLEDVVDRVEVNRLI